MYKSQIHRKLPNKPRKPLRTLKPTRRFTTSLAPPASTTTTSSPQAKRKKAAKNQFKKFVTNPPRQILSGIQPTGIVHIGNLFGAVSNWVSLQYTEPLLRQQELLTSIATNRSLLRSGHIDSIPFKPMKYRPVFYTVVDLHAITIPRPADELEESVKMLTATLLGCGIDPSLSTLFIQSHVTQHTELAWLLTCNTPVSWLYRMTQFKDKAQKIDKQSQMDQNLQNHENLASLLTQSDPAQIPPPPTSQAQLQSQDDDIPLSQLPRGVMAGLLQYPALMAADMLLYNATHIPVGDDQTQHLEFARELARTMNSTFSPIFVQPSPIHNPFATRVMSLRSPENKMSKSDPSEQGKISLQDSDVEIQKKVKSAVTDNVGGVTYDHSRPGLLNLLSIYAATENMKHLTQFHRENTTAFANSFFGRNNMLSTSTQNSESASQKLFDFAVNSMKPEQHDQSSLLLNGLNPTEDLFLQAVAEWESIANRPPPLISPQQLALKHEMDLLSVFKPAVGDSLVELINPIRNETNRILKDMDYMESVTKQGADTARETAFQTISRTKYVMGMRF